MNQTPTPYELIRAQRGGDAVDALVAKIAFDTATTNVFLDGGNIFPGYAHTLMRASNARWQPTFPDANQPLRVVINENDAQLRVDLSANLYGVYLLTNSYPYDKAARMASMGDVADAYDKDTMKVLSFNESVELWRNEENQIPNLYDLGLQTLQSNGYAFDFVILDGIICAQLKHTDIITDAKNIILHDIYSIKNNAIHTYLNDDAVNWRRDAIQSSIADDDAYNNGLGVSWFVKIT